MRLYELRDFVFPYKTRKINHGFSYRFSTSTRAVQVKITRDIFVQNLPNVRTPKNATCWFVSFFDAASRTTRIMNDQADVFATFSTIVAIIKEHAATYRPTQYIFSAKEPSRASMYRKLSRKIADELGYQVTDITTPKFTGFVVTDAKYVDDDEHVSI